MTLPLHMPSLLPTGLLRWLFALFLIASYAISTGARAEFGLPSSGNAGSRLSALVAPNGSASTSPTGAPAWVQTEQIRVELLVHAPQGVAPGKPLWLGLLLQHQPHWHTYWRNPGDSGLPTELTWTLPAGLHALDIAWPIPRKIAIDTLVNLGYEGEVLLAVPVRVDADFAATPAMQHLDIGLAARWLVCRETCIPQEGVMQTRIAVQGSYSVHADRFAQALAAAPTPFGGTVQVQAEPQGLRLRVQGLPAHWQGHAVLALPESAELLDTPALPDTSDALRQPPLALGEQGWTGSTWEALIPYSPQRHSAAASLGWVFQGGPPPGTTGQTTPAQAPLGSGLRAQAVVQGDWPAVQAPSGVSTALQAALDAQRNAQLGAHTANPAAGGALWLGLLGALLGGLLLNLMPCVFPVLALKVLAFASPAHSAADASSRRQQGLAYAAGVVLSFVALGGALLLLRAGGEQLGWGFQLQSPAVIVGLALLFAVLTLHLADWLPALDTLATALVPQRWAGKQLRHPLANAFLSGALAVAVASPCTAPFMGAALGAALTLPTVQALAVFAALGLGLAVPYLLASWLPQLGRWLPRPGAWMHTLRHALAFPLAATVVWLVWVLGHLSGADASAALLLLLLSLGMLVWALHQQGRARTLLAIISIAACAVSISATASFITQHPDTDAPAAAQPSSAAAAQAQRWQPWSPQAQATALQAGKPVFVDYTAAWCITCQVNKKTTLTRAEVEAAFAARGVTLLRADWTRRDPAITQALQDLGRSGVPVYVLHAPGAAPLLLGEILTPGAVLAALGTLDAPAPRP